MKVCIFPAFTKPDQGDGGIRRVVEAQCKYLPEFGIQVVENAKEADLVAIHGGPPIDTPKPLVAHCHGLYWQEYNWAEWAHDLNNDVIRCLRRADAVTAPSEWVAYAIRKAMWIDAVPVHHGIDVGEWGPGAKDPSYVLWNKTRVDPICDPAPLNELVRLRPQVKFVTTFGETAPNCTVTGRLPYPEAKKLVEHATVYLCTARETFGVGTLEAMASGAVVLGYNWGGQAEILTHDKDAWLVPPYDTAGLAEGLDRLLGDPKLLAKLAKAARRTAEQYTWRAAAGKYADVYRKTLAEWKRVQKVPRVSVIVTCYNLAKALPTAVTSVDDPEAEIIIVNDASPDDTGSVAAGLAKQDNRVRVVTNKENLYLAGALNAGIAASKGKYIVPLDADNEIAPGALAKLADALDTRQHVDIAYGSMEVVGGPHAGVSSWPTQFSFSQQMVHRNQIPSTSMYRRKVWERSGGYRRRCRTAEDADFWCRVTSLGFVPEKVTDDVTFKYHDRADSMSHVEKDWPWEAWYPWSRNIHMAPFGAARDFRLLTGAQSYEPSLITVVIPVGSSKHADLLVDALDSVWGQTYTQTKCVVVDDRPVDDRTCPLHVPPWVEVEIVDPGAKRNPRSPAHARNVGIARVCTPLFLPLDADDYLQPEACAMYVDAWRDRKDEGDEYFYSDFIVQETGVVKEMPDFDVRNLMAYLTHSVTSAYPTRAWREVGGFDAMLEAWEDWDFVIALLDKGYCGVHIPNPLFYYRQQAGSRREELYADRKRLTDVIKAKWSKYMVEGQAVACGCKDGRTKYTPPSGPTSAAQVMRAAPQPGMAPPQPKDLDGKTLIEFLPISAPRTYRGMVTGTEYRFGSMDGFKQRWVDNRDLPGFVNRRSEFRLITASNGAGGPTGVLLHAPGPPQRVGVK